MLEFIPPSFNAPIIDAAKFIWPAYVQVACGQLRVEISKQDLAVLEPLKNNRAIICPNHPTHEDPIVLFGLSKFLGERFNFLTAREIFKKHPSIRSRWLQSLGCYSIVRGAADIESFKDSKDLLISGFNKIVMFPEGEISHCNLSILALEAGPEYVAAAAAQAIKNMLAEKSIFLIPLGLLYRYCDPIGDKLICILERIEQNLGMPTMSEAPSHQRLRQAFEAVILALECEHHLFPDESHTLGQRFNSWREHVLNETAKLCGLQLPKGLSQSTRIHLLKNALHEKRFGPAGRAVLPAVPYNDPRLRLFYRELKRATRFISISDTRFDHDFTQDEAAELILILEKEICGETTLKADRVVHIGVGEPIEVEGFIDGVDKHIVVDRLRSQLAERIDKTIRRLAFERQIDLIQSPLPSGHDS